MKAADYVPYMVGVAGCCGANTVSQFPIDEVAEEITKATQVLREKMFGTGVVVWAAKQLSDKKRDLMVAAGWTPAHQWQGQYGEYPMTLMCLDLKPWTKKEPKNVPVPPQAVPVPAPVEVKEQAPVAKAMVPKAPRKVVKKAVNKDDWY